MAWLCGNFQGDVCKFSSQSLAIPEGDQINQCQHIDLPQLQGPGTAWCGALCPALGTIGAEMLGEIWLGCTHVASNAAQPLPGLRALVVSLHHMALKLR